MPTRANALRHSILAARDFKIAPVEVPEWGLEVHVRTMNVLESIAFEEAREKTDPSKVVALLLSFTLCDEDGTTIFEPGDVDGLCAKDPDVLSRIFHAALRLGCDPEASGDDAAKP